MFLLLTIIGLFSYFFFVKLRKTFAFGRYDEIMPGPPTLPLLGNTFDFLDVKNAKGKH